MPSVGVVTPTIAHDVKIAVPASPQLLTPFVLHEQQDWFEDELRFIRRFIRPGMLALDIGANYGVYTLSIAALTGATGHVWAFEPTEATAGYLRQSIAENQFDNVTLVQAGLSNRLGDAKLFTSPNSELNSLAASTVGEHETIRLLTLDHCFEQFAWTHLDFIKVDAEGEETRILEAATEALATLSPLIMFELKHGTNVNLPLLERFVQLGYSCYRLVPGLNALTAFDVHAPVDGYLLNLFCCKADTAAKLVCDGLLVSDCAIAERLPNDATGDEYGGMLRDYLLTLSAATNDAEKLGHLQRAMGSVRRLLAAGERRAECLTTMSRVAFAAGERTLGVQLLADLIERHPARIHLPICEPFLPASPRYDGMPPSSNSNDWLLASILEQYVEKHAFSMYFSGAACLPLFARLEGLGYLSEPMRRRYCLAQARVARN